MRMLLEASVVFSGSTVRTSHLEPLDGLAEFAVAVAADHVEIEDCSVGLEPDLCRDRKGLADGLFTKVAAAAQAGVDVTTDQL